MPEPFDEVPAEVEREVIADSVEIYALGSAVAELDSR
jgi:hypothetical protein